MNAIVSALAYGFWRLIPANPILVRVVSSLSKRPRHLWLRFAYLAVLFLVVFARSINSTVGSLSDLAKTSSSVFSFAAMVQLAMTCFLAPIFTAGAITQEKDSKTYNILISTPLTNAQIVFGSLLSRLFFVIMLLVGGLPIFFITMIYGGVTASQVITSFAISASTAVLTGSLAIGISMTRVGSRRTIFSFFLIIAMYLITIYLLGLQPWTWVAEAPANLAGQKVSLLAPIHPFLALQVALNIVNPPTLAEVGDYGIFRAVLAYPQTFYISFTLFLSLVITALSVLLVRRGQRDESYPLGARIWAWLLRREVGERRRNPRRVWQNPVAWREAVTRASAINKGIARFFLMGGGGAAGIALLVWYLQSGPAGVGMTRTWLMNLFLIEFGTILLLTCNVAASAICKEREAKTLDILMTTPVQAREIVWGKLRGVFSFAVPLMCVPVGTVLLFGLTDLIRRVSDPVVNIEAAFELALVMPAYVALTCIISLQISLRARQTVQATMTGVAVLIAIGGLSSVLIYYALVYHFDLGAALFGPFAPYTMTLCLIDMPGLFESVGSYAAQQVQARVNALIGSGVAAVLYFVVVWSLYNSMVRAFDMIMRKQTGN